MLQARQNQFMQSIEYASADDLARVDVGQDIYTYPRHSRPPAGFANAHDKRGSMLESRIILWIAAGRGTAYFQFPTAWTA